MYHGENFEKMIQHGEFGFVLFTIYHVLITVCALLVYHCCPFVLACILHLNSNAAY